MAVPPAVAVVDVVVVVVLRPLVVPRESAVAPDIPKARSIGGATSDSINCVASDTPLVPLNPTSAKPPRLQSAKTTKIARRLRFLQLPRVGVGVGDEDPKPSSTPLPSPLPLAEDENGQASCSSKPPGPASRRKPRSPASSSSPDEHVPYPEARFPGLELLLGASMAPRSKGRSGSQVARRSAWGSDFPPRRGRSRKHATSPDETRPSRISTLATIRKEVVGLCPQ